jgi:hypothetical protein
MSEECTDCDIGIEPGAVTDGVVASGEGSVEAVPRKPIPGVEEEVVPTEVPAAEEKEEIPDNAKVSGMLGLLTATCLLTDEDKREVCWKGIEPLEASKEPPLETMKRIIGIEGVDNVKKTMGALQTLIEEAEKELEK